jgi:hypothetical protein
MAKYQAKCDSYGVNGRYWYTGDEDEITADEIKKVPKAYFEQLFEKVGSAKDPE